MPHKRRDDAPNIFCKPKILSAFISEDTDITRIMVSAFATNGAIYTANQKHTKMFLSYYKRNPADPNKIWCLCQHKLTNAGTTVPISPTSPTLILR